MTRSRIRSGPLRNTCRITPHPADTQTNAAHIRRTRSRMKVNPRCALVTGDTFYYTHIHTSRTMHPTPPTGSQRRFAFRSKYCHVFWELDVRHRVLWQHQQKMNFNVNELAQTGVWFWYAEIWVYGNVLRSLSMKGKFEHIHIAAKYAIRR